MDCPSCGHEAEKGSRECALCGVRFDGWQPRRGRQDLAAPTWDTSILDELTVPRPVALSPRRFLLLVALVIVLAGTIRGIGLRWSDRAGDAATATLVGRGLVSRSGDSREVKGALSRLDPIFRQVEAEGRTHGVTFTLEDLEQYFEPAARPLDPVTAVRNAAAAGIKLPPLRDFTPVDKTVRGATSKCRIDGEWVYGERLPDRDHGIQECWRRLPAHRKTADGRQLIYRGTAWLDRWERYVWQPVNQRWAPLDEREEVRVLQYMIENTFGREAELRDREEASELLEQAGTEPAVRNDPRERATWIKSAILTANRTRIQREGARYRLDLLTR